MEINVEQERKESEQLVIRKFVKQGFDSLTPEDLGIAIT